MCEKKPEVEPKIEVRWGARSGTAQNAMEQRIDTKRGVNDNGSEVISIVFVIHAGSI